MEVIDGQQRLTTLMLLLRAFYVRFGHMQDEESRATREDIEKCIWKTDEFGKPDMAALKIDSEVATDKDKEEFLEILRTGSVEKNQKSSYALNYRFIQRKIEEFSDNFAGYFAYMPIRILNNCILLPIEAESQDTALRIFSTLNDRGKPLSDADIFKAQFYKFYTKLSKKAEFIQKWKDLDELCEKIFHPISGTPMDELFTRYMYYARAMMGIKSSTTEALRKFYEKDNYALLNDEKTFENLVVLAHFWNDVSNQDNSRFTDRILRRLFVLNYAPNGMWTYAVTNPGVNALRTPVYAEMVNIVTNQPVTFADYKFNSETVKSMFSNFSFHNARPITKSMAAWWAFHDDAQELLSLETVFEVEHIFARNRQDKENSLSDASNLESLGNKALLEKRINIGAADYRFEDKKKYYIGFTKRGKQKEGTKVRELIEMATTASDFTEADIVARSERIMDAFIEYLQKNGLTA